MNQDVSLFQANPRKALNRTCPIYSCRSVRYSVSRIGISHWAVPLQGVRKYKSRLISFYFVNFVNISPGPLYAIQNSLQEVYIVFACLT